MERLSIKPRIDWERQVESIGFPFHTPDQKLYWDESVCYAFKAQEILELETATNEVERMCMAVVDNVVEYHRYAELNIPEHAWKLIEQSWRRGDKNIFGRVDFSYDGNQPAKLLEYNADTPLSLPEASIVQKHWLEQVHADKAQFNTIHNSLVAAWRSFNAEVIHLTNFGTKDEEEEDLNITYIAETVKEAGRVAKVLKIENVLWDGKNFRDPDNHIIKTVVKLYAWEDLINDVYRNYSHQTTMQIIEPIWKMVLSNKALLVLLWELFPNHPNLLPTFFDSKHIKGDYVKKPLLGRLGENITLCTQSGEISSDGVYSAGPFVYQKLHPLPKNDGNYATIGSWLIEGRAAGISVREDTTPIINDDSRFVPHFIE
jgi:glutathionylspermidine synthase